MWWCVEIFLFDLRRGGDSPQWFFFCYFNIENCVSLTTSCEQPQLIRTTQMKWQLPEFYGHEIGMQLGLRHWWYDVIQRFFNVSFLYIELGHLIIVRCSVLLGSSTYKWSFFDHPPSTTLMGNSPRVGELLLWQYPSPSFMTLFPIETSRS